jgi:hypothetical protein
MEILSYLSYCQNTLRNPRVVVGQAPFSQQNRSYGCRAALWRASDGFRGVDGGEVELLEDLPVHTLAAKGRGDRAELDVRGLHTLLVNLGPIEHVFVERVTARPDNGSASMPSLRRDLRHPSCRVSGSGITASGQRPMRRGNERTSGRQSG